MEKREQPRIPLTDSGWHAELLDQVSGLSIGKVINLSPSGLMLLTPRALTLESLYQVDLRAQGPGGQLAVVGAGVIVLWRSRISQSDAYWSGLQIIDIHQSSLATLHNIIKLLQHID